AYGPTEATVDIASFDCSPQGGPPVETLERVPIGRPIQNTQIVILDKHGNIQPERVPGELYIAGKSLALGYLNKPELTAERFIRENYKLLTTNYKQITGNTLYRTGDLARWLPDGNIEFLGRIDYQVKIRGHRVELGEIENRILTHPEIKEAVVLTHRSKGGDNTLCAYYVVENIQQPEHGSGGRGEPRVRPSETAIRTYLTQFLPDYMIPSFFIQQEKIPLTPNGKIDRKALTGLKITKTEFQENYAAPESETEMALVQIWTEILEKEKEEIGINTNFFQLGGHSLKATKMAARIEEKLAAAVPLAKIFRTPTIREIAAYIEKTGKTAEIPVCTAENREYYPLSYNQQRMYILHEMQPGSSAYNMPGNIDLEHAVEPKEVAKALEILTLRHESLRTLFKKVEDHPRQFIVETVKNP
ncbi:MAG: AMP-binding protein, partial [bacterium]|nr:AMP-binding protein [bacterium]